MTAPQRIVSLVPSLTETVAELGLAERLAGVTIYCEAPEDVPRIGGTKNPDVEAVVRLGPGLVLANAEENRSADLQALRAAGLPVLVTFPRSVADVAPMLRSVGEAVGAAEQGDELAARVEAAAAAPLTVPDRAPRALVLVWRRPWMAAGADTFAADVLRCAGFAIPLDRGADRYPRIQPGDPALREVDVVVLPDEPYAFGENDLPAVQALVGTARPVFVDGRMLTWHGSRTAAALATFRTLAAEVGQ